MAQPSPGEAKDHPRRADPAPEPIEEEPRLVPTRKARVLFINDTARNGGPGRSLFYILRFLEPELIHRAVVLPRPGLISQLYERGAVTEDLLFEPDLVENPIEPPDRPMMRDDFDAPAPLKAVRATVNVVRAARAMARLTMLIRRGVGPAGVVLRFARGRLGHRGFRYTSSHAPANARRRPDDPANNMGRSRGSP